jgi:hypothetical protein
MTAPRGDSGSAVPERLTVVPITFGEAAEFVHLHHRHHPPSVGHKFSIAVSDENGAVRGVAIAGRPVARHNDDGWTLEVTRVATDNECLVQHDREHPKIGCSHDACSMLYGACWRAAKALGWRRLITYTLVTEPGTSLRAAGWKLIGSTPGRPWTCKSRPRVTREPTLGEKHRWEAA